ncbi:MAG: glycoside hydrolase family 31 protein [bacterium]
MKKYVAAMVAGCFLLLGFLGVRSGLVAPEPVEVPWPTWVFGHVVWHDESTTQGTYDLVEGYREHDIPVDGVIIDSPWETEYNTFVPDPELYPNMEKLISDLHKQDIRVILWITSMVNLEDPKYDYCLENDFFVDGMEERGWWKGTGGMIDYNNPEAVEWWHRRMDKAIALGLDGWKVDGTDPLMLMKGWKARKEYARQYYSDYFDYTRKKTGRKTVIMARPMEQGINESTLGLPTWANPFEIGLYLKFAPVEKSFMSWVGDQDPTFDGLKIATRWILDSARHNYLILGSDVGGYRGSPEKEVLIRWAQFGAFCPFMETGGTDKHCPWKYDSETVRIFRAYAIMHRALEPYLFTEAVKAWRKGRSMITPLSRFKDDYLLGDNIFVTPVQDESGKVKVDLPAGSDWRPLYLSEEFLLATEKCRVPGSRFYLYKGGCSFTYKYPLESFPVFLRAGSAIPLRQDYASKIIKGAEEAGERGNSLLLVPPAPGSEVTVEGMIFEEGKAPVSYRGEVNTSRGFSHTVESDTGDWPVVAGPGEVEPVIWRE